MTKTGRGAAYRRNAEAAQTTQDVELPSGAIFTLRVPNLEAFVLAGVLPFDLAQKLTRAELAGESLGAAFMSLPTDEQIAQIEFSRKMIEHVCVDPRVVAEPKTDDEIALTDLLKEDMKFIAQWAMSGGSTAGDSFCPRQEPASVARIDGKKRRSAAK